MKKLVIQFNRFSHYHIARLRSAANALSSNYEVIGLQTCSFDKFYLWDSVYSAEDLRIDTVFVGSAYHEIKPSQMKVKFYEKLDSISPDFVLIAGYASLDSRICLNWCVKHSKKAILMSETRDEDSFRFPLLEYLKSRRIRPFTSALVGSPCHSSYLKKLNFGTRPIFTGYNTVDNSYYSIQSNIFKLSGNSAPSPYFLASNRFVRRKNLLRLVQAFHIYSVELMKSHSIPSNLCLLGDGPEFARVIRLCRSLSLQVAFGNPWDRFSDVQSTDSCPIVFFPGFKQFKDLPKFYAYASAFIHPAITEPWGLVINEAMASGLPILTSYKVGAAKTLLEEGVNGFSFDPFEKFSISRAMIKFSSLSNLEQDIMRKASREILEHKYPASAFGEGLARLVGSLLQSEIVCDP